MDREKQSVTRNLMTDANGISRSLVVVVASTHDIKRVAGTLDAIQKGRQEQKLRLCLYKGDEACGLKIYLLGRRHKLHIPSHKVESDAGKGTNFRAHQRGVKNTPLDESVSSLPDLMEKKSANDEAMLHFPVVLSSEIKSCRGRLLIIDAVTTILDCVDKLLYRWLFNSAPALDSGGLTLNATGQNECPERWISDRQNTA